MLNTARDQYSTLSNRVSLIANNLNCVPAALTVQAMFEDAPTRPDADERGKFCVEKVSLAQAMRSNVDEIGMRTDGKSNREQEQKE